MFRDAYAVAPSHFTHGDVPGDGRLKVNMVRPNASSYCQLEIGSLFNALGGEIPGPEGLGDDYIGVCQLSFKDGIRPILVCRYDEPMSPFTQESLQAKVRPKQILEGDLG